MLPNKTQPMLQTCHGVIFRLQGSVNETQTQQLKASAVGASNASKQHNGNLDIGHLDHRGVSPVAGNSCNIIHKLLTTFHETCVGCYFSITPMVRSNSFAAQESFACSPYLLMTAFSICASFCLNCLLSAFIFTYLVYLRRNSQPVL